MRPTKNQQRRSPRVSVSMTPGTYQALVTDAAAQGVSASHLAARLLGAAVQETTGGTVDATGRLVGAA